MKSPTDEHHGAANDADDWPINRPDQPTTPAEAAETRTTTAARGMNHMADTHPSDKRTKGKPPTAAGTAKRMATALDRELISQLRHGAPAFNADGTPILDDQGQQVRRPPSAAVMTAARQRIQDLKREAHRAGDPSAYDSENGSLDAIVQGMSQARKTTPPPDPAAVFADAIDREQQAADDELDAPLRLRHA